jgi:hypothetical protein
MLYIFKILMNIVFLYVLEIYPSIVLTMPFLFDGISNYNVGILILACSDLMHSLFKSDILSIVN